MGRTRTTVLNNEELELFNKYKKKFGIASDYKALKHLVGNGIPVMFNEPTGKIPDGYGMPEMVTESMEKDADAIGKMKPETAQSELSKILGGKRQARRAIDAYSMYGADRYAKTMWLLWDRREPPQLAVHKIITEFRMWMLAVRAKGGNTNKVMQDNWNNHLQHGRFTLSKIDRSNEGRATDFSNFDLSQPMEFPPEKNAI